MIWQPLKEEIMFALSVYSEERAATSDEPFKLMLPFIEIQLKYNHDRLTMA